MTIKRIYELTEQATPATGDYLVVDKSGNAAAVKLPLAQLLPRVPSSGWYNNAVSYSGAPNNNGSPQALDFSGVVDDGAQWVMAHVGAFDQDESGLFEVYYRPTGQTPFLPVVQTVNVNQQKFNFVFLRLGTGQSIDVHTNNGPAGSTEVTVTFYVVGWL